MRSIANFSTKLSLTALTMMLSVSCAMANSLSEIQVNAEATGYGIVLKTDESAQMKKVVSSNNKMSIELKDVEVSPELNTIYNNVANIENVTVSPSSKSDIKIVFKGEGIANSKVYFETVKTALPAAASTKESIQLNGPVSSYTPVYNPDAFAETQETQTSNPQINEVLTKMHVTRTMLVTVKKYAKKAINKAKSGDINITTIIGILLVIAAFMIRPKKKSVSVQKQQSLTGILSNKKAIAPQMEREIGINRQMAGNMNLNTNPVKAGYGMKAYQQSQKNPYMTSNNLSNGVSGIARRKPIQSSLPVKKQTTMNRPVAPNMNVPIGSKAPSMINSTASKTKSNAAMEPSDLDSMKFLESITKIYEKNGRTDLAKGLKDNLKKAQLSGQAL